MITVLMNFCLHDSSGEANQHLVNKSRLGGAGPKSNIDKTIQSYDQEAYKG